MNGYTVILAYLFALILVYVVFRLFYLPLRVLGLVAYHGIVGALILWGVRVVGGFLGFSLAINPITALVAGFLGLPGVLLLTALRYVLV